MHAQSLQSCQILCDLMDRNLPASSVHGIFQARIPESVAMLPSRESSQPRDQTWISCIAGGFFTAKSPGKPGSLQIVATQLGCGTQLLIAVASLVAEHRL